MSKTVTVAKGLTRAAAMKAAKKKAPKTDFRGFTYNAKTGKAKLV